MTLAASALLWPGSGGFLAVPVAQARPGRPHGDEQLFSKRENLNRRCLPCFSVCSDMWVRLESGRCAARTRRYDRHSRARPGLIRPVSPLPPEIGAVSPFFNPAMDLCRAGPPFCCRRQLVVPPRWSSPRWSLPRSSPLVRATEGPHVSVPPKPSPLSTACEPPTAAVAAAAASSGMLLPGSLVDEKE